MTKLQLERYGVACVAVDSYRSHAHTLGTYLICGTNEATSRKPLLLEAWCPHRFHNKGVFFSISVRYADISWATSTLYAAYNLCQSGFRWGAIAIDTCTSVRALGIRGRVVLHDPNRLSRAVALPNDLLITSEVLVECHDIVEHSSQQRSCTDCK